MRLRSGVGETVQVVPYSPDALRRWPDLESDELFAIDSADRLILDESAAARSAAPAGSLVAIGDSYGALTLGAADAGGTGIRVHQDPLSGERALERNARGFDLQSAFQSLPLVPELVTGARVVLLRLPRALDELEDISGLIAAHADPEVVVFAGGRIKHMTLGMNDVLRRSFGALDVTHARQKSRVLVARQPLAGHDPQPRSKQHSLPGLTAPLTVCAFGGAFAGTSIDIGTRFLIEQLDSVSIHSERDVIDFACGTGVVAAWLALRHPDLSVVASDESSVAVASAGATARENGVADRIEVVRDFGLESRGDRSASLIALNPPFHAGAAVPNGVAEPLFAEAGRVLAPGGELWTVWNSPLQYRPVLERLVGRTRQVARNAKFTVTVSTRS